MVGNFLSSDVFPDLPHHQRSHVVGLSELVEAATAVMEARNQHLGSDSQSGLQKMYGLFVFNHNLLEMMFDVTLLEVFGRTDAGKPKYAKKARCAALRFVPFL